MASITIETIKKINKGCSNGFRFDIQDYHQSGDKNLSKTISIDENKMIKATLYFKNEIIEYRETGQKIPVINISVWTKSSESTMWSSGLGKFHYFKDKKTSRRNIVVLQELTKEITDDFIKSQSVDNRNESIFEVLKDHSAIIDHEVGLGKAETISKTISLSILNDNIINENHILDVRQDLSHVSDLITETSDAPRTSSLKDQDDK